MPGAFSSKRNFLFDLDGTLVDSVPAHARAYRQVLEQNHADLAQAFDYLIYAGSPTRKVFEALGITDDRELTDMTAAKQRLYREAVERGEVLVFPGALELVAKLHQIKRNLYLVTGANKSSALRVLGVSGLGVYFRGVTTAEECPVGKPSPEPYLYTLSRYKLEPAQSVAIEDAEGGIRSALAAGLEAILIHGDFPHNGLPRVKNCTELATLLLP